MKIELRDFQKDAVRALLKDVRYARREAREGGAQAIILSSPTGSGKTVTITALMECILHGDETNSTSPDREAVFLWLSDSPELNSQSRDKLLSQCSVFREHELIIVEPSSSRERFEPGKVYFLNTQKLGKDNLLTKTGDGRDYTIWQTIENTAQAKPDHFYMVIDEAHRGMNRTPKQEAQAQSIVQKFIFGDATVGLSPIKLIIGISATPEKFVRILKGSGRTKRECVIPPAAVRESGLLKDRIVLFCPEKEQPADWTLLTEAAKRWRRICNDWRKYCKEQGIPTVEPALVIQVADGIGDTPTRTDLAKAVEILEREAGSFNPDALAHCFEVESPVAASGYQIRKIEPSKIQRDTQARVIFFKMALSTGWDCPRAEVMMSFRTAQDHTSIAQLVGRMVRTPLARRIESSELLNTVSLYLPHYDRDGLDAIVGKLNDPENAPPTEVVDGSRQVTLKKNPKHDDLFSILAKLPSDSVERIPKTSNTRRLVKLARRLTFDKIDRQAWNKAKALVVKTLAQELERLRHDTLFAKSYRANQVIEIREVQVEAGEWKVVTDGEVKKVKTTPENIDDLFEDCHRQLGEGLNVEFWKKMRDPGNPQRAKLELYGVLRDKTAWDRLEAVALERIEELYDKNRDKIEVLPSSKQEEYDHIQRQAKAPQTVRLRFPDTIEVGKAETAWTDHLYVDDAGRFGWDAESSWEAEVLKAEMAQDGFVAWLRNEPRKRWSLCVQYERGGKDCPLFPDLLIFRRDKDTVRVRLLDPHDPQLHDAADKAKGLARYAAKHSRVFDAIELIALDEHHSIKRLDVSKERIREKVLAVRDTANLTALFKEQP